MVIENAASNGYDLFIHVYIFAKTIQYRCMLFILLLLLLLLFLMFLLLFFICLFLFCFFALCCYCFKEYGESCS